MSGLLPYLGALVLFLIGLRLAAFFSGAETGFYRVSYLRVSIDAQSGDPVAKRILWFCQNPTNFVVTALIGNNVAHYILMVAVGIAAVEAGHQAEPLLAQRPLVAVVGTGRDGCRGALAAGRG